MATHLVYRCLVMRICSICIFAFLASLCWVNPAVALPKVMFICSYHPDMPWVQEYRKVFVDEMGGKAEFIPFYLDYKRLPKEQSQARAEEAFNLFMETKPDLVVLADDFAVESLGRRINLMGTPVVFLGVNNNPRNYLGDMRLATGVLERPLVKRSIVFIHEMFDNDIGKCLILFDNGKTANLIVNGYFGHKRQMNLSRVWTDIRLVNEFEEWQRLVREAPANGYDIIIVGLYHTLRNRASEHVSDDVVIRWTSEHSRVPIFGIWDFSIGQGKAVGGLVNSATPQGREAAKLALKILQGADPQALAPVTAEGGRFVFSKSELKRWGLSIPNNFYHVGDSVQLVD